jgi:iron(III) transport system substrate-binding protein
MPAPTRRSVTAGLGALAAAPLLPRLARADEAALAGAARKEGGLTWYVAQVDGETAENMARAFTQHYPGVKVSVMRTTGQVAYERLMQDLRNNTPQCDVFSTTDIAHMPALMKRNALARYAPDNAQALAPALKGLGEEGFYYPTTYTLFVILYNSQKVRPEEAPRAWTDLLDPKWKGRVALGHPGFSGYMGVWTLAMRDLYRWDYFDKLARNNPRIGRSAVDPVTLLNAGEVLVGASTVSNGLLSASKGNPIGVQYPADGSVLCIGPSGVLANAPHPNAARLFANWLLSPDFARVATQYYVFPARADAPTVPGAKPLDAVKLIRLTTAQIGKGVPEIIEQWRDTFS